jgi:hypothetical protein
VDAVRAERVSFFVGSSIVFKRRETLLEHGKTELPSSSLRIVTGLDPTLPVLVNYLQAPLPDILTTGGIIHGAFPVARDVYTAVAVGSDGWTGDVVLCTD